MNQGNAILAGLIILIGGALAFVGMSLGFAAVQDVLQYGLFVICPFIIILVLLQGGAGDVSSSFGGGGQLDSTLGVGANRKLAKITVGLIVLFMGTVLVIQYKKNESLKKYVTTEAEPTEKKPVEAPPKTIDLKMPSLETPASTTAAAVIQVPQSATTIVVPMQNSVSATKPVSATESPVQH
jgi:protein translocase SecG subunit